MELPRCHEPLVAPWPCPPSSTTKPLRLRRGQPRRERGAGGCDPTESPQARHLPRPTEAPRRQRLRAGAPTQQQQQQRQPNAGGEEG